MRIEDRILGADPPSKRPCIIELVQALSILHFCAMHMCNPQDEKSFTIIHFVKGDGNHELPVIATATSTIIATVSSM